MIAVDRTLRCKECKRIFAMSEATFITGNERRIDAYCPSCRGVNPLKVNSTAE